MAKVELARHLGLLFPQLAGEELRVEATTVAEVVQTLEARAPGFAFYVCDERGRLRQHVNIFVGQDRVSDRQKLTDPVTPETVVMIVQALSGG
jgi:sulfur-carrier protein